MKRVLLGIFLITVFLVGCGESTVNEVPQDTNKRFNGIDNNISIVTDSETNCKYIYIKTHAGYSSTSAMSPLMKNHSQVDCGQ